MKHHSNHPAAAFSLIEVTLALGIAAFCLLSVFGLMPLGLSNTQTASEQTAVSGIATAISSDLHSVSSIGASGTTTGMFSIPIPGTGTLSLDASVQHTLYFTADGSLAAPVDNVATSGTGGTPRYRATVTFNADPTLGGINTNTTLYKVWVFITWPALADPQPTGLPSNFSGSYEYVTSLNLFPN